MKSLRYKVGLYGWSNATVLFPNTNTNKHPGPPENFLFWEGGPSTIRHFLYFLVHPQIMKNHKKGMTMAHVLQQGLWGEGILHSEQL